MITMIDIIKIKKWYDENISDFDTEQLEMIDYLIDQADRKYNVEVMLKQARARLHEPNNLMHRINEPTIIATIRILLNVVVTLQSAPTNRCVELLTINGPSKHNCIEVSLDTDNKITWYRIEAYQPSGTKIYGWVNAKSCEVDEIFDTNLFYKKQQIYKEQQRTHADSSWWVEDMTDGS